MMMGRHGRLTNGTTRAGRAPVVAGGVSIDNDLAEMPENKDAEQAADITPIGYSELRLE